MELKNLFLIIGIFILLVGIVSAVRLPVVGADEDTWGTTLNEYLSRVLGNNATTLNITNETGLPFLIVNNFGNVGVNTSTPQNTLNVVGDFNVTNITGDASFYVNNKGSVGVGTSSPDVLNGVDFTSFGYNVLNINGTVTSAIGVEGPIGVFFFIENDAPSNSKIFQITNADNKVKFLGIADNFAPQNTFFALDRLSGNFLVGGDNDFEHKFKVNGNVSLNDNLNISNNMINISGETSLENLAGTYTNGEAYVCVYDNGTIFAKDSACS